MNRCLTALIIFFITNYLIADTQSNLEQTHILGSIEYKLPISDQFWEMQGKIESDTKFKSATIFYTSENNRDEKTRENELFMAHVNDKKTLIEINQDSLIELIRPWFSSKSICVEILENSSHAILFETNSGEECVVCSGMWKILLTEKGTAILCYLNCDKDDFLNKRFDVLLALRQANFLEHTHFSSELPNPGDSKPRG